MSDDDHPDYPRVKIVIGDRVRLIPFEDQPEEFGVVEYLDLSTALVRVDGDPTEEDDRVREVPYDQIEGA